MSTEKKQGKFLLLPTQQRWKETEGRAKGRDGVRQTGEEWPMRVRGAVLPDNKQKSNTTPSRQNRDASVTENSSSLSLYLLESFIASFVSVPWPILKHSHHCHVCPVSWTLPSGDAAPEHVSFDPPRSAFSERRDPSSHARCGPMRIGGHSISATELPENRLFSFLSCVASYSKFQCIFLD